MRNVKYLILGAGPAGLTVSRCLADKGITDFLLVEKEDEAGGLCRSINVDGSPFDIGGGHFLDTRRPDVVNFLFRFMPIEEWDSYTRDSKIDINGIMIDHPFEANIWQMPHKMQEEYLLSIEEAGCNQGESMPERFVSWITWKLGNKIANDYMLPYNRKMFANDLDELGTYWLEKLPNVSYEDTLKACKDHKSYGIQPGHATFYYPKKYGYGEVWLRIADSIKDNVQYKMCVNTIDFEKRIVGFANGEMIQAEYIISTIPWTCFESILGVDSNLTENIQKLKYSAVETRYVAEQLDTKAQWIYVPEATIPYHRILVRHNFCPNSRGCWIETRKERIPESWSQFRLQSEKLHPISISDESYHYLNEYAYPLNTIEKPDIMKHLLASAEAHNVYGLGRWGEHCHYNSDYVVELAMKLADELVND